MQPPQAQPSWAQEEAAVVVSAAPPPAPGSSQLSPWVARPQTASSCEGRCASAQKGAQAPSRTTLAQERLLRRCSLSRAPYTLKV